MKVQGIMGSTKDRLSYLLLSLLLATGNAFIAQFASAENTPAAGSSFAVQALVPIANEGCGPGYWKTHPASWPPTGYSPGQRVVTVFSAAGGFPALANETLMQSLQGGGGPGALGGATILLRAAVAAILNASDPDIDYPGTVASVLGAVNAALASDDRDTMLTLAIELDEDNNGEGGCPLD